MIKDKIKKLRQLKRIAAVCKKNQEKIVFTNGCFDILHLGHVLYLEQASLLGDKLVVALNSDASVRKIKGKKRPLTSVKARAGVVAALECVDYVIVFSQATPAELIKYLQPDVLVKGSDWQPNNVAGSKFVQSYGGRVKVINFVKGYSTSSIIARIKKGK